MTPLERLEKDVADRARLGKQPIEPKTLEAIEGMIAHPEKIPTENSSQYIRACMNALIIGYRAALGQVVELRGSLQKLILWAKKEVR